MRTLLNLLAEAMIGWHQGRREAHRRAERKWRARLKQTDASFHFPPGGIFKEEQ